MENASLFEDQRFPGTKVGKGGYICRQYPRNPRGDRSFPFWPSSARKRLFVVDRPSLLLHFPPPEYLPFVSLHVPGLTNVFNIQPRGIVSRGPTFQSAVWTGFCSSEETIEFWILMNRFFQGLHPKETVLEKTIMVNRGKIVRDVSTITICFTRNYPNRRNVIASYNIVCSEGKESFKR